ncbi:hypothetical protein NMY22_g5522 [Coprinellus aureogranulatus]|nr:hypothetical protein NMY22_g5522 [Coprinellus aureogranulatus]
MIRFASTPPRLSSDFLQTFDTDQPSGRLHQTSVFTEGHGSEHQASTGGPPPPTSTFKSASTRRGLTRSSIRNTRKASNCIDPIRPFITPNAAAFGTTFISAHHPCLFRIPIEPLALRQAGAPYSGPSAPYASYVVDAQDVSSPSNKGMTERMMPERSTICALFSYRDEDYMRRYHLSNQIESFQHERRGYHSRSMHTLRLYTAYPIPYPSFLYYRGEDDGDLHESGPQPLTRKKITVI